MLQIASRLRAASFAALLASLAISAAAQNGFSWVENGRAPDRIVAGRMEQGRVVRTRPLCPYPQTARWDGRGSVDEDKSFSCR